jgi:hypothetical protein
MMGNGKSVHGYHRREAKPGRGRARSTRIRMLLSDAGLRAIRRSDPAALEQAAISEQSRPTPCFRGVCLVQIVEALTSTPVEEVRQQSLLF